MAIDRRGVAANRYSFAAPDPPRRRGAARWARRGADRRRVERSGADRRGAVRGRTADDGGQPVRVAVAVVGLGQTVAVPPRYTVAPASRMRRPTGTAER
jgi:hypothetical protein